MSMPVCLQLCTYVVCVHARARARACVHHVSIDAHMHAIHASPSTLSHNNDLTDTLMCRHMCLVRL
jgi:hypothetical protein